MITCCSAGQRLSSNRGCAALVGWMPSGCIGSHRARRRPERSRRAAQRAVPRGRDRARETGPRIPRRSSGGMRMPTSTTLAPASRDCAIMDSKVVAHLAQRQAAQTVVAAELQDHDCRFVQLQRARQAGAGAASRLAADAGVHHTVTVPLSGQSPLQQRYPGRIDRYAITCAQAVADHEDHGLWPQRRSREPMKTAQVRATSARPATQTRNRRAASVDYSEPSKMQVVERRDDPAR